MNRPENEFDDSKPTPADLGGETIRDNEENSPGKTSNVNFENLGPYQIIRKIGEGGMGAVYLAQQESPIRRRVALKVIRHSANSSKVISRFEQERQALAMMDHPNIAKILDAGTENGLPYFAMELVDGVPMHHYCDEYQLSIQERLRLFVPVCKAVQHAHQKGVIHRDLKPSNVLVDHNDGNPVVKVIDFGLAKATGSKNLLGENSFHTDIGKIVGTIQYMSPEQAGAEQGFLDTRTDIYSLGVMLYELLTGSIPLDAETVAEKALLDILAIIRDWEPPRPSLRLASSTGSISSVSENRQIAPRRLESVLKGDLDWIVMKAIEKDRNRRYETASGLADDINRFLNSDIVLARPPSRRYRATKFIGRNRLLVATLAALALLLTVGAATTSWFAYKSNMASRAEQKQKVIAQNKSQLAESERDAAQQARKDAETSAKRAAGVLQIVSDSFESTNPVVGGKADMKARDVLLNAQKALQSSDLDDIGKADLLDTLTVAFNGLGEVSASLDAGLKSMELRKATLGIENEKTVSSMNNLAGAHLASGNFTEAIDLFEAALKFRESKLGLKHSETLDSFNNLGMAYQKAGKFSDARRLLKTAFEQSKKNKGPEHIDTLTFMNNLALSYQSEGKLEDAIKLYQESLEIREKLFPDHPGTLITLSNIAQNHKRAGRLQKAITTFSDTLKRMQSKLGNDHPFTLATSSNLARAYSDANQVARAISLLKENVKMRTNKLGDEHPDTLETMADLAGAYLDAGDFNEAVPLYEKTLEKMQRVMANDHPDVLTLMNDLARAYGIAGNTIKEAELHERTFEAMKTKHGEGHVHTLSSMVNLAGVYIDSGRVDEAIAMYERAVPALTRILGSENPQTLASSINLGAAYSTAGKIEQAIEIYETNLPAMENLFGASHPNTIGTLNNLAGAYMSLNKHDQAIELFEKSVEAARESLGESHHYTIGALINLASANSSAGRIEKAIELFNSASKISAEKLGEEHAYTIASLNNLATAYFELGSLSKAIELYSKVVNLRKKVFGEHPATFASINSLAVAYQKNKQIEKAIPWFEENLDSKRKVIGIDHPSTEKSIEYLVAAYQDNKQWQEAHELMEPFYSRRKDKDPESVDTVMTGGRLGRVLIELGNNEEAGQLLIESYNRLDRLSQDENSVIDKKHLAELLGYLVTLSQRTKNSEELEKWEKELEKIKS